MEPNTKIIWHEGIPSLERLKGNILMAWWKGGIRPEVFIVERQKDFDSYNWSRLIKFAILSEEIDYCKWKLDEAGYFTTNCGGGFVLGQITLEEYGFKFCPFCGSTINPVERIKPLDMDGLLPKFVTQDKNGYYAVYGKDGLNISLPACETKEQAVIAWNEFRNKLQRPKPEIVTEISDTLTEKAKEEVITDLKQVIE